MSATPYLSPEALVTRERLARFIAQRLKGLSQEDRKRPFSARLVTCLKADLYEVGSEQAGLAWRGVEALAAEGLIQITYRKARSEHLEPWYREPWAIPMAGAFERLAGIGHVTLPSTFAGDLAAILAASGMTFERATQIAVRAPVQLGELAPIHAAECLQRLIALALAEPDLFLREASARLFNGRSKVLDAREDWLALVLYGPCPWCAPPVQLQVGWPEREPTQILLVENLTTFERLRRCRGQLLSSTVLVYAAGFKAAAERVAKGAVELYFDREPDALWRGRLGNVLQCSELPTPLPIFFFGDLDFAGLAILRALRSIWPDVQAWPPGYAALMAAGELAYAHAPEEADKAEQRDGGVTGCSYADERLLPWLRRCSRFVDQELYCKPHE